MAVKKESRGHVKERLTIRKRGQVTLPKSIMERFQLEEGDSLDLVIDEKTGEIKVVPMISIPADQRWFWTDKWQKEEQEAEEDIAAGRVKSFDNIHEAINWLDSDDAEEWAEEEK
jgi:AbrB family looped-hinge helix DNA binding protein